MAADPNDSIHYDDCGFDISHLNEDLNFSRLATTAKRKFCIVKITEGHTFQDPMVESHLQNLISAGITRLGVYHFAHHGDPKGQMQFFLDTFSRVAREIGGRQKFLFMLDLEVNDTDPNPPRESDGLAMVQHLQSVGIPNPIIYCGGGFWTEKHPELVTCGHLLAAYNDHPTTALPWRVPGPDTYGWDIWQYTGDSQGPFAKNIPGGSTGMDLDCFNLKKHPDGFEQWWDAQLEMTQPDLA